MGGPSDSRQEHDTMGMVTIPTDALWGPQTQRAVGNFPISGLRLERSHIEALALVKKAAARANAELGVLDPAIAKAIERAAGEVASGTHDDHFPVDVYQTGSGTSSNMNANEVIASLASSSLGREIFANDHVNASQSSNDVFPTSVHVAALSMTERTLIPALEELADAFGAKARDFGRVVKAGRTHLMDATPVTLGQEFGGYEAMVRLGIERLEASLDRVAEIPLGGTAVGTGVNAPEGFASTAVTFLGEETGLALREARDHFEAQGSRDALVELHGVLKTIAVGLTKTCNDLRWMGSGPNAGLGEIRIPALQPGSSIMPGKVNPVVPEAVLQVCSRVVGNDATVTWAGASGAFELNVQVPVIAFALLESIRLLAASASLLASRTVLGIEANTDHMRRLAEASPSIVTPLSTILGYEAAASVVHRTVEKSMTIREAVLDLGFVERGDISEEQLDSLLDVDAMTGDNPT